MEVRLKTFGKNPPPGKQACLKPVESGRYSVYHDLTIEAIVSYVILLCRTSTKNVLEFYLGSQ